MRINKIKLAGFKSFVDPTTLNLPHTLTGVVGPNGCGKSNVIDAVLWVLGESSAKHLRGDAMSDVIFSGSNSRKPVGQASVEIIFDNSDGKIGGEYAGYNEISIKRQLGRDGVSVYNLNGNRCRRKDVTNLFLGTGIGPRSYSVIEQGMISRVIESKPEELRIFLEEAAGISKYKERRRETENRIRHSKENLDRLNDIRDELEKQLNRLERQAKAAERYKVLKGEERQVKAELMALAWKDLSSQASAQEQAIKHCETEVEGAIASVRSIETEIEKEHQQQVTANDQFNEIQGRYYGIGAEISRLEQAIQHAHEKRQNAERDTERVKAELNGVQQQISSDQEKLQAANRELSELEPKRIELKQAEQDAGKKLEESENTLQSWQAEWNAFQQRQSEHVRTEQEEQGKMSRLDHSLTSMEQRIERLLSEKNGIVPEQVGVNLEELQTGLLGAEGICQTLENKRSEFQAQTQATRENVQALSAKLDELRREYQENKGRLASLEALQQSALGKDQRHVQDLLQRLGLDSRSKLAQEISVEPDWETALEAVLADHLDSLCVSNLDQFGEQVQSLSEGSIGAIEQASSNFPSSMAMATNIQAQRLLDKVSSDLPLEGLMAGVYVVDSVDQAMQLRSQLAAHESLVTKRGDRIGSAWLRLKRDRQEQGGVLEREREIRELTKKSDTLTSEIDQVNSDLEGARERRGFLEKSAADLIIELETAQRQQASISSELAAGKARFEQAQSRIQHIEQELTELRQKQLEETEEAELVRERLSGLNLISEDLNQQQELLNRQRDDQTSNIQQLRADWRETRDKTHELALRSESLNSLKASMEQSVQRYQTQQEQLDKRYSELTSALEEEQAPVQEMQQTLEETLSKRLTVESELTQARESLQAVEQTLKAHEQKRHSNEGALQTARDKLEKARVDAQAVSVRLQSVNEQLHESGFTGEKLLEEMPEDAGENSWKEKLEAFERKINRLGPINLAAIDECKELSERKNYLDQQNDDLVEALDTLETAIRKIDKETRTRFKDIYDRVNEGFQTMFPRLFGGGEAHLELTGEDLLETGVAVIAKPPGKRNSSIHLLSGGEKALTAVALVFSIFQLNPAPFCLLDEVDAPLDDANVARLCNMLVEMAEQVQFIFISHNKITMEIAEQLIGVTMQEAGVSRLVTVDMDEAVSMVATG